MKKNNNTLIIFIIIIIVILVLLYYYFINISITQTEKYNCNIKNCPIITKNDDKLYMDYFLFFQNIPIFFPHSDVQYQFEPELWCFRHKI